MKRLGYPRLLTVTHGAGFYLPRWKSQISLGRQLSYSPFLVQMVVTRRCDLQCGYCHEYDVTSDPVPTDLLLGQLDKLRSLGAVAVELTGGEPLLHPDLIRLVRHATRLHFPARMLISNAFLLKEEMVLALNEAGLTHLQISVDGVKANAMTKKTLDVLQRRLEGLSRLARFKVVMSGVIGACPAEETLELVRYAQDHGFVPRVLLLHDDQGQINLSPHERQQYERTIHLLGPEFQESHGYRNRLLAGQTAPFKCRAGARYIYLDEHGNANWCSQTTHRFSKPILEYGEADLKRQFNNQKGACVHRCSIGCARTCSALDERRSQLLTPAR